MRIRVLIIAAALAIVAPAIATLPADSASAWTCTTTIPASATTYGKPFPATWQGFKFKMTNSWDCGHSGTDWDLKNGSQETFPVWAVATGKVTNYTDSGCYGKYTRLAAADGVSTLYAHLKTQSVTTGSTVTRGQGIGWAGATGTCPGGATHLHLAQTKTWNGWASASTKFFNSRTFLDQNGVTWTGEE